MNFWDKYKNSDFDEFITEVEQLVAKYPCIRLERDEFDKIRQIYFYLLANDLPNWDGVKFFAITGKGIMIDKTFFHSTEAALNSIRENLKKIVDDILYAQRFLKLQQIISEEIKSDLVIFPDNTDAIKHVEEFCKDKGYLSYTIFKSGISLKHKIFSLSKKLWWFDFELIDNILDITLEEFEEKAKWLEEEAEMLGSSKPIRSVDELSDRPYPCF